MGYFFLYLCRFRNACGVAIKNSLKPLVYNKGMKNGFFIAFGIFVLSFVFVQNQAYAVDLNMKEEASLQSSDITSLPSVEDVVEQQLKAIRLRNDRAAFELSTQKAQDKYKDPQSYMRDIRREKDILYNHVDYEFLGRKNPTSSFYKVSLTDKKGNEALALFKMNQNSGNSWRVEKIVLLLSDQGPL